MEQRRSAGPPIEHKTDGAMKDCYQVTVDNAETKTQSTVYIAKEAVPAELNTYLYVAASKESMEEMLQNGTMAGKGVVFVGEEGLQRTAYFIKNGALITRTTYDGKDDKTIPVTATITIPSEQQMNWSPMYYSGLIGKTSEDSKIEAAIDNAIKAAGKPAPLPIKKERDSLRDLLLQKASLSLVSAHANASVTRYYVATITPNTKDKYTVFFTSPDAGLTHQHHSFSVSASLENIKASKVTATEFHLKQGEKHQAELEEKAKEFNILLQKAKLEKKQAALGIAPNIEENVNIREAKEKAELEEAKKFFNLSAEELGLLKTASDDFIKKMQQCTRTIVDLKKVIEKKSDFSQSAPELASRLEKNTQEKKEALLKQMQAAQDNIMKEMRIHLPLLQEQKNQDFKQYLLLKYKEAQQAISSDALICNLMENAIRDTLLKYDDKDKQNIIGILKEHGLLKDTENIIFNRPPDKTQLAAAINTIFDKLNPRIGAPHPYSTALKEALQAHLEESMQSTTEFFIFKKDKLELNEKTLQKSRETSISAFKENVLLRRKSGIRDLDKIHQGIEKQITTLQQTQEKYLDALTKERADFLKITAHRTTLSKKAEETFSTINTLLQRAEIKKREADALLDQAHLYEFTDTPHQRNAWLKAVALNKQAASSVQALITLRNQFGVQAKLSLDQANSKDITVDECQIGVQQMEKIASDAMHDAQSKLTAATQATMQLDKVMKTVEIENTQQKLFYLLKIILTGEGQIDYWNDQRKIGGIEIKDREGKTQKVPTGIGKMILMLNTLSLKEGGISDIQSFLELCAKESEDRLSRKAFLGHGTKIGRQEPTSEVYSLMKEIKNNLHNKEGLKNLLEKFENSKAFAHYEERYKKQLQKIERKSPTK